MALNGWVMRGEGKGCRMVRPVCGNVVRPRGRGVASLEFLCVEMEDRTCRGMVLESSRKPLMAPSRWGSTGNIGGCGVVKGEVCFIPLLVQVEQSCRVIVKEMVREGDQSMERHSPTSMEDNRDGCHYSQCGGKSARDSSMEFSFNTLLTGGVEDLRETWFRNDNSTTERKSLSWLEREMEVALSFKHGDGEEGGPRVHPIWIIHILLGCLF